MPRLMLVTMLSALACSSPPDGELPDVSDAWSEAEEYDVQETVAFTTEDYDLEGTGTTIGDLKDELFPTAGGDIVFATGDGFPGEADCPEGATTSELPVEIEGIVTLHPRWYIKLSGCNRGDEKYYGNYFIEDDSGGLFVVGDSKVAHFDVGDRIKMRVRAVRTNFGFDMIYAHDIVEVHREANPIKYTWANDGLTEADAGEVRRVRGEMITEPDTFGSFLVRTEDGVDVAVNLDAEINRRRQYPEVGETICATGPVLNSFGLSIVIMRLGQIAVVEDGTPCPDAVQD